MDINFTNEDALLAVAKQIADTEGNKMYYSPTQHYEISNALKLECVIYVYHEGSPPELLMENLPFILDYYLEILALAN